MTLNNSLELITSIKNMQKVIIEPIKRYFLRKRNIIETIIDKLKNSLNIDHTRHRLF